MNAMIGEIKAVLFDLDDTLFDRQTAQGELVRRIVVEFPDLVRRLDEDRVFQAFFEADRIGTDEINAGASVGASHETRSRQFLRLLDLHALVHGIDGHDSRGIPEKAPS